MITSDDFSLFYSTVTEKDLERYVFLEEPPGVLLYERDATGMIVGNLRTKQSLSDTQIGLL